jgi:hypothetical protein
MGHEPGKRVGVILKIIDNEVRFLGWALILVIRSTENIKNEASP